MSAAVTLNLPDEVLERATLLARRTNRAVADVLSETIELGLEPLGVSANGSFESPTASDAEVIAAVEAALPADEDRQFSELLDRQQAETITVVERAELHRLMQLYQAGLLRKAHALKEAVRRGLRPPLEP